MKWLYLFFLIQAFSDVEKPFLFSDLMALTIKSENKKGFSMSEKAWTIRLSGWHEVDMYNYTSVNLSLRGE